jgi:peptide/nickel transport system substrate-binding protein
VAVRQAISYAINRAHLIQDFNGARLSPPLAHVLPDGRGGAQFLYRPSSSASQKAFQTLQSDLGQVGIKLKGLGVPDADFYTKYLEVPSVAKAGTWDVALAGWGPDWYGDAATSFFKPLFSGKPSFPPVGSNFGFYSNPTVSALITKASSQANAATAATMWAQADQDVMKDAPFFPITQPLQPLYHASYVHNAVYVPAIQEFDPTNVWLGKPTG